MVILKPVAPVKPLPILADQQNGRLTASILVTTPAPYGGAAIISLQIVTWSWQAMFAAARDEAGIRFKVTSTPDTYRTYAQQVALFTSRYQKGYEAGVTSRSYKTWNGERWYLLLDANGDPYATAAVPGESNHGWARALDLAEELDGDPAPGVAGASPFRFGEQWRGYLRRGA